MVGSCLWSRKPRAMDLACQNRDEWNWHGSAKENRKIQVKQECGKSGNVLRKGAPCSLAKNQSQMEILRPSQRPNALQ